ncbi:hypothetical protein G7Y79_00017g042420 [Physcia stellaris]|nr:hypothetical protein G7Y79_00017g042420 [Physcia stellaris]
MAPSDNPIIFDIAILICQALSLQGSQGTLASVSRVSKSWNSAARPELYRSLVFDLRPCFLYRSKRILASLHPSSHKCQFVQDIDVTDDVIDTDLVRNGTFRPHEDGVIALISDVLSRCNNLRKFSWNVVDPLPSRVLETLAMNPRLSGFNLRLVSSGSTEASNYLKLLTGSSKITELQILLESERTRPKQAMEYKDLIVSLPVLDSLEMFYNHYHDSTTPTSVFEFHTFPSVSSLVLRYWPFYFDGPKAIQHQIDCAKLDNLQLSFGMDIDRFFAVLLKKQAQLKGLTLEFYMSHEDLNDSKSSCLRVIKTFPTLAFLKIQTYHELDTFYTPEKVASLAETLWPPTLQVFTLEVLARATVYHQAKEFYGRHWRTKYDKLTRTFEVTDLAEDMFEGWIKRLANAKGELYVPRDTKEEKLKGWWEATDWFADNQGMSIVPHQGNVDSMSSTIRGRDTASAFDTHQESFSRRVFLTPPLTKTPLASCSSCARFLFFSYQHHYHRHLHISRSSPKKNKGLKKTFSPKKHYWPKEDVKVPRAEDAIAALRKAKKGNGSGLKGNHLSYSKSSSLSPQLKKMMKSSPLKRKNSSSFTGSPKKRTYTKYAVSDGSPKPRIRKSTTPITVPSTTPTPEPVSDDEVPSYEFCAYFGFYGKKADVARSLIRSQKQLIRLTEAEFIDAYANDEFTKLFSAVTATGVKVSKGDFELWDGLLLGIKRLLEMRLEIFGVLRIRLTKAIDGHDISEWSERTMEPRGLLKELYEIAVNLHQQIMAAEEFDREDDATDNDIAMEEGMDTDESAVGRACVLK